MKIVNEKRKILTTKTENFYRYFIINKIYFSECSYSLVKNTSVWYNNTVKLKPKGNKKEGFMPNINREKPVIELENVCFSYDKNINVIKNVSLSIFKGIMAVAKAHLPNFSMVLLGLIVAV